MSKINSCNNNKNNKTSIETVMDFLCKLHRGDREEVAGTATSFVFFILLAALCSLCYGPTSS